MDFDNVARNLQNELALIDLLSRPSSRGRYTEFLVKKLQNMKIKMYQEKGHSMPHIHIDYGNQRHAASYSIETHKRLAGNLNRKYDAKIKDWMNNNKSKLLDLWNNTQRGQAAETIISEIQGNT